MKCEEIVKCLERLSPRKYACDWDNVGLLVGRRQQEVDKVFIALDPSYDAVQQAIEHHADMLITHHPMIFKPIKQINDDSVLGKKILSLAENHIAYYAMHTNFDIVGSMADAAAERIGINEGEPLEVTSIDGESPEGIGRVGELSNEMSLEELAELVKKKFNIETVMVYGELKCRVKRIAICPGSGKSEIGEAIAKGAQVLITGDIGHHEGLDAVEEGLPIIDATHYGLEHIFMDFIKEYIEKNLDLEIILHETGSLCRFL